MKRKKKKEENKGKIEKQRDFIIVTDVEVGSIFLFKVKIEHKKNQCKIIF